MIFKITMKIILFLKKDGCLELMSNTLSALRQQKQNSITNKLLGMEEK